ncbi:MAG TPA: acyl-CoA desaturase [Cytophagales bacterium]|nr:acyl-CoA desaturase [Cytophagales bacterium]
MNNPKFNHSRQEFFKTLRKRVEEYFTSNNLEKTGNTTMYVKTIVMLTMYFVPYFLLVFADFGNYEYLKLFLVVLMGVGVAGIGLSIQHDANHGSYSNNSWINAILGETLTLVGGNSFTWKIQHNVLHHTYTNVHGHDEDIRSRFILVFSPHAEKRWFHKYQHIYALPLYSLLTISFLFKDFRQYIQYTSQGLTQKFNSTPTKELLRLVFFKAFYIFYMLILPIFIMGIAWHKVLLAFFIMHFIAGTILSLIFQMAHVMEATDYPLPTDENVIENNWAIHQMETTCNFSTKNRFLTWYCGGLNHQVEHHLFPNICHVHYNKISKIVKETAQEFDVPYYEYTDFGIAFASHINALKKFGGAK